MALNFQPPPQQQKKSKTEAFLAPITQGLNQMPALMLQYEALKRQGKKEKFDAATERVKNQIELLKLGRTQDVLGPDGSKTSIPGVSGYEISLDENGLPFLKKTEGVEQTAGSAGVKIQPPQTPTNLFGTTDASGKLVGTPVDLGPGKLTIGKPQNTNDAMVENRNANLEMRRIPPLPAGENKEISDMDASRNELRKLIKNAEQTGFGSGNPLVEKARTNALNPLQYFDPNAQKFKQYVAQTKQIIGKALEGGVLRKEDEYKYDNIIPRGGDTTDILTTKADQLDKMISDRQAIRIENFKKAFRNVPEPKIYDPIIAGQSDPGQSQERKAAIEFLVGNGKVADEKTIPAAIEFLKRKKQ